MQLERNSKKASSKLAVIIISAIVLVALIAAGTYFAVQHSKLSYDKIYDGIKAGDVSLGKMTLEDANKAVLDAYPVDSNRVIKLFCEGEETSFSLLEAGAVVDGMKTAENAFLLGRDGKRKEKLELIKDIKKNGALVDVVVNFNEDVLLSKINEIANKIDVPERELAVSLEGEELVITRGKSGWRIIEETAREQIRNAVLDTSINEVGLITEKVNPHELTVEYLEKEVCTEPQDASYTIENQRLNIIPEKLGVKIDSMEAKAIIDETPGDVVRIPAIITPPEVTAEKINAELFPHLLATYQTTYTASNISRSHNVSLASQNISNCVLAPGDVFSYNDTVGPRTAERGFREAGVYVGNKVEQGLGGGICQVSSTLFNAVVLADLEIVYRMSHSLPVSYVPLGRDATVSYGSIDFKFANNTGAPIKIIASAVNGRNTVSIYGTKKNPNRTISITTECTAVYPPDVEKIEDPTLPIGTVEVEEKGAQGSSHITYKIIKENGTSKTEVLTRSTYQATDRVERVGTKEVEEVVAEQDGEVTQETDTTLDEASTETNNSEETSAEKPEITDGGTIE